MVQKNNSKKRVFKKLCMAFDLYIRQVEPAKFAKDRKKVLYMWWIKRV